MPFSKILSEFLANGYGKKTEVAKHLNVSVPYIIDLTTGRKKAPTLDRVRQIASALRLSKEETDRLLCAAAEERIRKEELDIIRGTIDAMHAPLRATIRGASTCPHCSKEIEFEIDGKGEVLVSGKVTAKVRKY